MKNNVSVGKEQFFIKACFGSEGPAGTPGKDGETPTVSVGTVQTVEAGQKAEVVNSGTDKAAVLDFKIPKGPAGENTSLRAPHYNSYEELAAQHPAGTAGEAYLVGELNFIYVWDVKTNSWVTVGKLGYLPDIFTDFRETVEQELAERYTKVETDGQISAHNLSGEAHADIRQALETLQLLKLVDILPAQGESKYIYAVPQDERTTDGQLIVVLFIWAGTEWAAVGALTTSVDLSEYLKKTEASSTYTPLEGGNMGKPLSAYTYVNNTAYYYWNKLFNIADIKVNDWAIFLISAKNDYNTVISFSHLLYVSRYSSAGSYSVLLSPLVSFNNTADGKTEIYVAADGDNNIYVQARATWVSPGAFKIIKIVGDVNFTPEKAGYALLGEDPENFTSLAKIEDSGAFKVSLPDNNVLNYPASYNVLKLTSQYAISDKNGDNIDTTYIKNTTKGVSGGVASLGSDGKVPQEQLPNVSAATPVTALGQISTASLQTNNNYTASVSGGASITLPTPADTTIANKITVNLTVLSAANINWGANVNAALAEFTPGKYQIRLLWNNTSSEWSAEVLKETAAVGDTVVLCHFDGNCSNEAGGAVINQLADANQVTWEELTPGFGLAANDASLPNNAALFQFDDGESLVLDGDFTIEFTVKNLKAGHNAEYTMEFTDKLVYQTLSATSERHGIQCHGYPAIAFGGKFLKSNVYDGSSDKKDVAVVRSGDSLYYYENGSLIMSGTGWQGVTLDLRGWYIVGNAGYHAMTMDELRISRSAKYLTNYTPATSPFVLTDSGVSDLHDIKMAELYTTISALQNELQILKGQTMKRLDYANAIEFYLNQQEGASYTVPANGWLFGYGYQQTKKTTGTEYWGGGILINDAYVGQYFIKTSSKDSVNQDIPLSMPLQVSAGDVITTTGDWQAFSRPYLFVPEKEA